MALWDDADRTLQIANAGSVQPLFVSTHNADLTHAIDVHTIAVEGFPLGLFPGVTYEEQTLTTQAGDLIVFFSDGIVDAENIHGEMYGTDRLCTLLRRHPTAAQSADGALQAILEAVTIFQAGAEHFDDETVVALRVL